MKTLQFKGYDSATVATMTGAAREIIIDTTEDTITVHDGVTVGGTKLARKADLVTSTTPASLLAAIKTVDGAGSGLDADTLDGVQLSGVIQNNQADVGIVRLNAQGTGNEFNMLGIELLGDGPTNAKPGIGFHQPSLYAGTLTMRDAEVFDLKKQDGSFAKLASSNGIYSGVFVVYDNTSLSSQHHNALVVNANAGSSRTLILPLNPPAGTTITVRSAFVVGKSATILTAAGSNAIMDGYQGTTTIVVRGGEDCTFVFYSGLWYITNFERPFGGVGMSYNNLTASRSSGFTYTNDKKTPIFVCVSTVWFGTPNYAVYVDGILILASSLGDSGWGAVGGSNSVSFVVPAGSTYRVDTAISNWMEMY